MVDGFPIGPAVPPDPDGTALATRTLDEHDEGHAPVVAIRTFLEQDYLHRSGAFTIYVFTLADGTYRATGVHCHPSGCDGYWRYPH